MSATRCVTGKRGFRTKTQALVHASKSLRRDDCDTLQFRAYECFHCTFWHLTKQPKHEHKTNL